MPDRTGSLLRALLQASTVTVVVSLGLQPTTLPEATGRQDHQALIDQYRRGDAEAAVVRLAVMGSREAERLRPARPVAEAPWDWAASILLRTEASSRRYFDTSGALRVADRDENPYAVTDRWEAPSLRTLRALLDHAAQTGDERLLEYCRQWYINTLQGLHGDYFTESIDLFPNDPEVLLARGRWLEFWMGPETEAAGAGAIWMTAGAVEMSLDQGLVREERQVRTAHGLFASDTARKAMDMYGDALEADPSLAEARLRLGRVLFLMDRPGDGLRELERTLTDSRVQGEAGTQYLAALFAGQVHEFESRPDEAVNSYRHAIAACPRCPSAPAALLRLQLASGRPGEGWEAMGELFRRADQRGALTTDPWALYAIRPDSFLQVQRAVALRHWIRVQ